MCGMSAVQPAEAWPKLVSKNFRNKTKQKANLDFLLKNGSDCAAEKMENFFFQKLKIGNPAYKM